MLTSRIEDQGTRLYDVNGSRLPALLRVRQNQNQQFLKDWRPKLESKKQSESKMYLVVEETAMHKFLEHHITGVGYDDLTALDGRKPWPKKLLTWVSHLWKNTMVRSYVILPGLYAGSTDLVFTQQS